MPAKSNRSARGVQSAPNERALRLGRRGLERADERRFRTLEVTGAPLELADRRVPQVVTQQPRRRRELSKNRKARFGAPALGNRNGAIERVNRRW